MILNAMSNNSFILDSFIWSFSRINSYNVCPRMFYFQYIKCCDTTTSFFSEFGSFCHEILEKHFNGELELFELSNEYINNYDKNIKHKAPPNNFVNLNQKYYDAGKLYFDEFEGLKSEEIDYDSCKVIGVEEEIHIKIGEFDFVGYIDLILEDKNGNIIILDHKSKKMFKSKREKKEYLRQLYIYSIYILDKYNKLPIYLVFNFFKENKMLEEAFNIDDFKEAKQWALDTIQSIYDDVEFGCNKSEFFCNFICSCSAYCPCSQNYLG